jgi:hypothetical protein
MSLLIEQCSETFVKRLIGRTDVKDAMKRLDRLTYEEAWMGIAQNLRATRIVSEASIVDDRVRAMDDKIAEVIHGA